MRLTARLALISAALLPGAPSSGQEQQSSSPSEIVVTGTREREKQVRDFVAALTPAPAGSIPRFIEAICPVAAGLVPSQNEAVAARLRNVAAGANLDVAEADCPPNAFVIVTRDKRAFIEALAQSRPDSFGMLTALQIRRLARTPGPAAAWQLEGPVTTSGVPLRWDERKGAYVNPTTEAASRIRSVGRRGFDAAVLVVEAGALEGLTPIQLADYAAMRLFAKLDPARLPKAAPPTILSVLTTPMGSPVALTMTNWDLGFLRGLYSSAPNLVPGGQRSEISRQVNKELAAPEARQD